MSKPANEHASSATILNLWNVKQMSAQIQQVSWIIWSIRTATFSHAKLFFTILGCQIWKNRKKITDNLTYSVTNLPHFCTIADIFRPWKSRSFDALRIFMELQWNASWFLTFSFQWWLKTSGQSSEVCKVFPLSQQLRALNCSASVSHTVLLNWIIY